MAWLISNALMNSYENSLCLLEPVEEFSEENCSDGKQCAQSNGSHTQLAYLSPGKMTEFSSLSRYGMTLVIAFFIGRCKIDVWIKNTNMANRATASSAKSCFRQEIKEANRNAARMLAVAFFKRGKPQGHALSALKSLSRHALAMRHAQEHAGQICGFHEERLTQWLMSGRGLPFSHVRSSQDVSETKQIGRQFYLVTRLKSFAPTLRHTSSLVCRGTTTEKGLTNGA